MATSRFLGFCCHGWTLEVLMNAYHNPMIECTIQNTPPLRKSELEYYAMLSKTSVHHFSGNNVRVHPDPLSRPNDEILWRILGVL